MAEPLQWHENIRAAALEDGEIRAQRDGSHAADTLSEHSLVVQRRFRLMGLSQFPRSVHRASMMTTKDTQKLIIDTAINLFNEYGTARISANRIADTCDLSRGHLYYHFKKKRGDY